MDFLLWTTRGLHIFAVVVWFGGLMYQAAVLMPVAKAEKIEFGEATRHFIRRFQPFVWMCVWTSAVTGIALMMFDPRFVFFQYSDRWSIMLGVKQLVFVAMVFFSFGYMRMFKRMDEALSRGKDGEQASAFYRQMLRFGKINVALAIGALLLAAGLSF